MMEAVNRKRRMLCVVFLGAALSIAARLGDAGTGEVIRAQDEYTASTETGYADTDTGTDEAVRNLGAFTPPAELHYVETDARQEGNELIFGNLVLELPEGVIAETAAEAGLGLEEGLTIWLDGAEQNYFYHTGPFPPKIGIARYNVEYGREEALVSALLSVFGGYMAVIYEDRENNEYLIRSDDEDYNNYAIVRGKELYLVREFDVEAGYSFWILWSNRKIKWQDSGKKIKYDIHLDARYLQVMPEEGISFLCCGGPDEWSFYLEGYFDSSYTSIERDKYNKPIIYSSNLMDINFDGCTDISLDGYSALIWDSEKKEYIKVEYPEDMPSSVFWKSFPETETIWTYDYDYLSVLSNRRNLDYTESLWQWDGYTLVKIRECTAEVREDGVRILAYGEAVDELLFDERFMLEEWEDKGNESIWDLYRQFYDGWVPEGSFFAEEAYEPEIIPQGLLDEITESMRNGTELETLKAMMNATELDDEECCAAARENDDIRAQVIGSLPYGYIVAKTDVDNDGIEDLVGEFFLGSSDGTVSFRLFQGQADGTYIERYSFGSVREEFGVIEYEGKNYLIRTLIDYGKKLYNGFSVMVFEEGHCVEEAELMLTVRDYELTLASAREGYEDCAEELMEKAVSYGSLVEEYEEYEIIVGSAEELAEVSSNYPSYICDLDNDGELEHYDKHIRFCSSMDARNMLTFECIEDDEGASLIQDAIQERYLGGDYFCPMMLWADEVDGGTVVNVLYQTGLWDFVIVGYMVDGTESTLFEVYEIAAEAVPGVEQTCR